MNNKHRQQRNTWPIPMAPIVFRYSKDVYARIRCGETFAKSLDDRPISTYLTADWSTNMTTTIAQKPIVFTFLHPLPVKLLSLLSEE